MNPDSEEPFLKEAGGKLAAAAASFWLLSAAGTIAALALALAAPATGGTCVCTRRVEGKNAHAYSNK